MCLKTEGVWREFAFNPDAFSVKKDERPQEKLCINSVLPREHTLGDR